MTKEKGGVTAPTEPLKLTLEEAMRKLAESNRVLIPGAQSWWIQDDVEYHEGDSLHSENAATWPEVCELEWGVPVVARDDAAELRAALVELVRLKNGPRDDAYYHDREHAWAAARAALAATDGSE